MQKNDYFGQGVCMPPAEIPSEDNVLISSAHITTADTIHEQNVLIDNDIKNQEDDATSNTKQSLRERLVKDDDFRRKFILWIFLCMSSGILGWVIGQLSPSLLDLKEITNSRLEEALFFLTSVFIGYLIGAIVSGAIYQRMNPFLLIFLGNTALGVTSAAIPWCSLYGVMVSMHIVKGFGYGVLDTAGNSVFISNFKHEKGIQSYLHAIHLMFAVGGFLSPIATAPFLMQDLPSTQMDENLNLTIYQNTSLLSTSSLPSILFIENSTDFSKVQYALQTANNSNMTYNADLHDRNNTEHIQRRSVLYKAYLISAGLCFMLAISFLFMCFTNNKTYKEEKSKQMDKKAELPNRIKFSILFLMCLFLGIDQGMEDTFFGLFTTFVVVQLGWTKKSGSYITSLYWASFACGRISAIFIGQRLKASNLLRYYINVFLLAMIGLFVSTMFAFDIGIWIFFPVMGFTASVFFPSIFLWTQDFLTVAGKVSSLLLITASLGSMLNPILIGYLMDNNGSIWFAYIILADGIVMWIMVWVATYVSHYVKKYRVDIKVGCTEI
ncbi:sodium-dependent glucose transporter 1-like [Mytilus californianus]|uniref:sodium-dependent glucose transporter 1-like n=1 Tax=Mytilus californianus TaxID=6549 RepID=UPI00224705F3|nr:sodium-dependent glucose transporter 1-like [Mytilus californianus]XP_052094401.1 sodium-dependent glucose transporter 1-like [Mytilus californianus]